MPGLGISSFQHVAQTSASRVTVNGNQDGLASGKDRLTFGGVTVENLYDSETTINQKSITKGKKEHASYLNANIRVVNAFKKAITEEFGESVAKDLASTPRMFDTHRGLSAKKIQSVLTQATKLRATEIAEEAGIEPDLIMKHAKDLLPKNDVVLQQMATALANRKISGQNPDGKVVSQLRNIFMLAHQADEGLDAMAMVRSFGRDVTEAVLEQFDIRVDHLDVGDQQMRLETAMDILSEFDVNEDNARDALYMSQFDNGYDSLATGFKDRNDQSLQDAANLMKEMDFQGPVSQDEAALFLNLFDQVHGSDFKEKTIGEAALVFATAMDANIDLGDLNGIINNESFESLAMVMDYLHDRKELQDTAVGTLQMLATAMNGNDVKDLYKATHVVDLCQNIGIVGDDFEMLIEHGLEIAHSILSCVDSQTTMESGDVTKILDAAQAMDEAGMTPSLSNAASALRAKKYGIVDLRDVQTTRRALNNAGVKGHGLPDEKANLTKRQLHKSILAINSRIQELSQVDSSQATATTKALNGIKLQLQANLATQLYTSVRDSIAEKMTNLHKSGTSNSMSVSFGISGGDGVEVGISVEVSKDTSVGDDRKIRKTTTGKIGASIGGNVYAVSVNGKVSLAGTTGKVYKDPVDYVAAQVFRFSDMSMDKFSSLSDVQYKSPPDLLQHSRTLSRSLSMNLNQSNVLHNLSVTPLPDMVQDVHGSISKMTLSGSLSGKVNVGIAKNETSIGVSQSTYVVTVNKELLSQLQSNPQLIENFKQEFQSSFFDDFDTMNARIDIVLQNESGARIVLDQLENAMSSLEAEVNGYIEAVNAQERFEELAADKSIPKPERKLAASMAKQARRIKDNIKRGRLGDNKVRWRGGGFHKVNHRGTFFRSAIITHMGLKNGHQRLSSRHDFGSSPLMMERSKTMENLLSNPDVNMTPLQRKDTQLTYGVVGTNTELSFNTEFSSFIPLPGLSSSAGLTIKRNVIVGDPVPDNDGTYTNVSISFGSGVNVQEICRKFADMELPKDVAENGIDKKEFLKLLESGLGLDQSFSGAITLEANFVKTPHSKVSKLQYVRASAQAGVSFGTPTKVKAYGLGFEGDISFKTSKPFKTWLGTNTISFVQTQYNGIYAGKDHSDWAKFKEENLQSIGKLVKNIATSKTNAQDEFFAMVDDLEKGNYIDKSKARQLKKAMTDLGKAPSNRLKLLTAMDAFEEALGYNFELFSDESNNRKVLLDKTVQKQLTKKKVDPQTLQDLQGLTTPKMTRTRSTPTPGVTTNSSVGRTTTRRTQQQSKDVSIKLPPKDPNAKFKKASGTFVSGGPVQKTGVVREMDHNTCYLGSAINMMLHIPSYQNLFRLDGIEERFPIGPNRTQQDTLNANKRLLAESMRDAFETMANGDLGQDAVDHIFSLMQRVGIISLNDTTATQNDISEIMTKTLAAFNFRDYPTITSSIQVETDTLRRIPDQVTQHDCSDLTDGNPVVTPREPMPIISLPILGHGSLQDAFDAFQDENTLSGDNAYLVKDTDGVYKKGTAKKTISFDGGVQPEQLTFDLKRFVGLQRDNHEVTIPEEMRFNGKTYKLKAMAFHDGQTINSGHYTFAVKEENGDWTHHNDGTATKMQGGLFHQNNSGFLNGGYMYTYEKID